MNRLLVIAAAGALLFSGAGVLEAKLNVVASTPDLGAIAREIGGEHIDLTVLARPTEDPHFVDPKPSFIVKLNRADVLIEGGAELEVGWLPALLEQARNPRLQSGKPGRIAAAEGVTLLEVPTTLDRSKGDVHAAGNPHYLTDPANGKIVAERVAAAFCELEPASCDAFQRNLEKFNARLEAKTREWDKTLQPFRGRPVVSYHNYWFYFASRFDLKMNLYLEPKPGIPPSPSHLASVITRMREEKVRVILVQPHLNRRTAETVANHTGAVVLDFPSFPNENRREIAGYIDWMDHLVRSLAQALGKEPAGDR